MNTGVEPLKTELRDVCFLHWPVPESRVDSLVPDWLTVDTADGSAWISALPMRMASLDVLGVPVREAVEAVALRTYVRSASGDRGVYFCSVDATDRPAAETARRLLRSPHFHAEIDRTTDGDRTSVRATRRDGANAAFAVSYEPSGHVQPAGPDTLASFLAERYRYFTEGPFGTRLVGSVGHDPWQLQSATASVTRDSLLETVGLHATDERPLVHYSDGVSMRIGAPRPLALPE